MDTMSSKKNNICILKAHTRNIVEVVTCQESHQLSSNIENAIILKYNLSRSIVGILMDNNGNNILIPSIISSLMRNEVIFIFIDEKEARDIEKSISSLPVNWILTFTNLHKTNKEWSLVDSVTMATNSRDRVLFLFQRINSIIDAVPNLLGTLCIFRTSGTTGKSKLVKVQRDCIMSNVTCLIEKFNITSEDVIYLGTQLTFDPSLIELLLASHSEASFLIVPENIRMNPNKLYETLFPVEGVDNEGITILQIVPSVFKRWSIEQQKAILLSKRLKVLAFGGEPFPEDILGYPRNGNIQVFNLYGITEVSCWATLKKINENCGNVSLGEALNDTIIEIRNECGEKIVDEEGEIYIGSSYRICYIDNEETLTKPVFRRTGDLGIETKSEFFYRGRKNFTIKRFGHKVNLHSIEKTVQAKTNLICKCVHHGEENKLLLFVLLETIDKEKVLKILDKFRVKLLHILPKECFPDFIESVPKFPVTSHGKLDSRFLLHLYEQSKGNETTNISVLFCKYLGINLDQLEKYKNVNFFELGGNSISAVQLLQEVKEIKENSPELVEYLYERNILSCIELINSLGNYKTSMSDTIRTRAPFKKKRYEKQFQIRWQANLKACVDSAPVIYTHSGTDYVAVGSFSHLFSIFNANNGIEYYTVLLPDVIESQALVTSNGSFLFIGCFNGNLYCLNHENKSIEWVYSTGNQIKSTPCFCNGEESLVFGSYDKNIHCINVKKGSLKWKLDISESVIAKPLYNEFLELLYFGTIFGSCICVSKTGEVYWRSKLDSPIFSTPCFLNDSKSHIVFAEVLGIVRCFSAQGDQVWTLKIGKQIFSSLRRHENMITFGCLDSNVYILKCDIGSVQILSKVELDDAISSSPCIIEIASERVIITASNGGTLFVINLRKGEISTVLQLPEKIFSSPVVKNDKVYIGCRDNFLYCLDIT